MKSDLYIPKTLKIGFQKRKDTFTGKLAFISYINAKGAIFYEGPWERWRDKSIEIMEVTNTPRSGYIFNKDIVRDGYHFSSGRSIMRVYDSRDFEFEITIENLTGILSHSDISKSEVAQECIFAWSGQRLILLPTNSKEYLDSLEYTEKQHKSVKKEDLKIGFTYVAKKSKDMLIFVGQEKWYDENYSFQDLLEGNLPRKPKGKKFIFAIKRDNKYIYQVINPETLSECIEDIVHPEFAEIKIGFEKSLNGQTAIEFVLDGEYELGYNSIKKSILYKQIDDNTIMSVSGYRYWIYSRTGRNIFKKSNDKDNSAIDPLSCRYYKISNNNKTLEEITNRKHSEKFENELFGNEKTLTIDEVSNFLNKKGFKAIKLKALDGSLHDINDGYY